MRKFLVSSVLVLVTGAFAGNVFAGKIEACEAIKSNPVYKGLYGLCNAYWNADENARPGILENFYRKAGPKGPDMPGLNDPVPQPVVCPCWPEGEIDIGVVHDVMGCEVTDTFAIASYDLGSVQYNTDTKDGNFCAYYNFSNSTFVEYPDFFGEFEAPTDDEMDVCELELLNRIDEDFVEGCL